MQTSASVATIKAFTNPALLHDEMMRHQVDPSGVNWNYSTRDRVLVAKLDSKGIPGHHKLHIEATKPAAAITEISQKVRRLNKIGARAIVNGKRR